MGRGGLVALGVGHDELVEGVDGLLELLLAVAALADPVERVIGQRALRELLAVELEAVDGQVVVALEVVVVGHGIGFLRRHRRGRHRGRRGRLGLGLGGRLGRAAATPASLPFRGRGRGRRDRPARPGRPLAAGPRASAGRACGRCPGTGRARPGGPPGSRTGRPGPGGQDRRWP